MCRLTPDLEYVFVFLQVNLSELKAFPNPPNAVTNVTAAVMVLLAPRGRVPKDRSWKAAKVFMGKVYCVIYILCIIETGWPDENPKRFSTVLNTLALWPLFAVQKTFCAKEICILPEECSQLLSSLDLKFLFAKLEIRLRL